MGRKFMQNKNAKTMQKDAKDAKKMQKRCKNDAKTMQTRCKNEPMIVFGSFTVFFFF